MNNFQFALALGAVVGAVVVIALALALTLLNLRDWLLDYRSRPREVDRLEPYREYMRKRDNIVQ